MCSISSGEQSYGHGAWFIARAVDGDYLQVVALWSQLQTQMADLKMVAIDEVSKLLSL